MEFFTCFCLWLAFINFNVFCFSSAMLAPTLNRAIILIIIIVQYIIFHKYYYMSLSKLYVSIEVGSLKRTAPEEVKSTIILTSSLE